jgi:hypothetical protein
VIAGPTCVFREAKSNSETTRKFRLGTEADQQFASRRSNRAANYRSPRKEPSGNRASTEDGTPKDPTDRRKVSRPVQIPRSPFCSRGNRTSVLRATVQFADPLAVDRSDVVGCLGGSSRARSIHLPDAPLTPQGGRATPRVDAVRVTVLPGWEQLSPPCRSGRGPGALRSSRDPPLGTAEGATRSTTQPIVASSTGKSRNDPFRSSSGTPPGKVFVPPFVAPRGRSEPTRRSGGSLRT